MESDLEEKIEGVKTPDLGESLHSIARSLIGIRRGIYVIGFVAFLTGTSYCISESRVKVTNMPLQVYVPK